MPDFTIRGNPGAIRARATLTAEKATLFDDTGEALSKIDTSGWTGRAADTFRDAHDLEPERWFRAGNGFRTAGAALLAYADAVEQAQVTATWAEQEYARGEQATGEYRSWFESESDRLRTGLANGTYSTITLPVWDDPGAAIRDNALAELDAARAALDNAAHVCAGEVRAGCADAPEEPSWWESGLKFVGGIFQGAGEALWDIATLLPFSPANLVQDAWKLATGDLTPEELAKTYELDLETVQGMWHALQDDPVEFGKNLGKGLLDWDTWADDPARAIGHLVPDAVAAVATGGAATAATRGAGSVDDIVDGMRAIDRMSDAGALSRLDDLSDLSRLDQVTDLSALERSRIYSMMDDLPHTTAFAPEQLGPSRVDGTLDSHGLDRNGFIDLVNTPLDELTDTRRGVLESVRNDLPAPDAASVMQKVVPPDLADRYIMGSDGFQVDSVRGAVTHADDTAHLGSPQQIHDGLRLDYEGSPYSPGDESTHVIRFQTDTPDFEVPRHSDVGGSGQFDDWGDPFTGNGFTKAGDDVIPEYAVSGRDGVVMREGAEMWEVTDTGTQRLVAVLRVIDGEPAWVPQGS